MSSRIQIGTSGWVYKHWKGVFYPEGLSSRDRLEYYNERFGTVEVNNSFYNLPKAATFENWADSTSDDFVFAVKASRYITHMKKLKDPKQAVSRFFSRVRHLGDKLGPVLFQLPPSWHVNVERLDSFLNSLSADYLYAFEFRDPSWFVREIYDVLSENGAALCIYDMEGDVSEKELTADFVYVRLHGPGKSYQGSYTDTQLGRWADELSSWAGQGRDIYCYFNNDPEGHAPRNALRLKEILT